MWWHWKKKNFKTYKEGQVQFRLGTGITFIPCPIASGKRHKFRIPEQTLPILDPERRQWIRKHIRSSSELNPRFPCNHVSNLNPTMMSCTDYSHERRKCTLLCCIVDGYYCCVVDRHCFFLFCRIVVCAARNS